MKSPRYPRYQDYVIRDGKLVGEFDEMYQDFADPWQQTVLEPRALDKSLGIAILQNHGHHRPLEYGCGLGHYTARLHRELGAAAGLDISLTAIAKAKERNSGPSFYVGDILDTNLAADFKPDALVFAEISWYVLERLPEFKALALEKFHGIGFLHMLTTYPGDTQRYGAEHFRNLAEIMTYWSDAIAIEEWAEVGDKDWGGACRTLFYGKVK